MEDKISIRYSEHEKDLVGSVLQGEIDRCDLYLVFLALLKQPIYGYGISLIEELEKRGYDKTTLKFEIKKTTQQHEYKGRIIMVLQEMTEEVGCIKRKIAQMQDYGIEDDEDIDWGRIYEHFESACYELEKINDYLNNIQWQREEDKGE